MDGMHGMNGMNRSGRFVPVTRRRKTIRIRVRTERWNERTTTTTTGDDDDGDDGDDARVVDVDVYRGVGDSGTGDGTRAKGADTAWTPRTVRVVEEEFGSDGDVGGDGDGADVGDDGDATRGCANAVVGGKPRWGRRWIRRGGSFGFGVWRAVASVVTNVDASSGVVRRMAHDADWTHAFAFPAHRYVLGG